MSEPTRIPRPRSKACPICGQPARQETAPFCSKRCADIDLSRWLKGVYAIPVEDDESKAEQRPDNDDESR